MSQPPPAAEPIRNRQIRLLIWLAALIALLLLLLLLLLIFRDGDGEPAAETSTTAALAATTTSTFVTTTTTPPTTTSSTSSTSTTSTTTTTTTAPSPTLLLEPDGLGVVDFGADPATTIAAVTAALGIDPDVDTGLIHFFENPYGTCPMPQVRGVEWGKLVLLFTNRNGPEEFADWSYADRFDKPGAGPHDLTTAEGIGLGSTVAELEAAYGASLEIFDSEIFGPVFHVDRLTENALFGTLTGAGPGDAARSLSAGFLCGE
ncbi:MAG: hypothetical protein ACE5KX_05175 [Acidimicrobiia bacterium]